MKEFQFLIVICFCFFLLDLQFFVLGTQSGQMYVLNIEGVNCSNTFNNLVSFFF